MTTTPISLNIPCCVACYDDVFYCQTLASCNNKIRHVFHKHCAEAWANQFDPSKPVTCPLCVTCHLVDVAGTKKPGDDSHEDGVLRPEVIAFFRWMQENPDATTEDINARVAPINASLGRNAVIVTPRISNLSPIIGLSFGFGIGIEILRQFTISELVPIEQNDREKIDDMLFALSAGALAISIISLASDLLTKRISLNDMTLAKKPTVIGLKTSAVIGMLVIAFTVAERLIGPQRS